MNLAKIFIKGRCPFHPGYYFFISFVLKQKNRSEAELGEAKRSKEKIQPSLKLRLAGKSEIIVFGGLGFFIDRSQP
jgi:hypothetical protein